MSLLTVLKTIGKDLSHVGAWIEDGLKVITPVVDVVYPPLGAIFTEIEAIITKIQGATSQQLTAATLQAIVTAVTMLEAVKIPVPTPAAPAEPATS